MSKIGRKPVVIPEGVTASLEGALLKIKGPKGDLSLMIHKDAKVTIQNKEIIIEKAREVPGAVAVWGLTRALINNLVIGVKDGYEKKLELQGLGYRMSVQEKKLVLALGFSHPVEIEIPDNLNVKTEEQNILSISGIDKQAVGQFAANVRALKKVEPYKGKGFRYVGEKVRRKAGKKAVGTAK